MVDGVVDGGVEDFPWVVEVMGGDGEGVVGIQISDKMKIMTREKPIPQVSSRPVDDLKHGITRGLGSRSHVGGVQLRMS